MAELVADISTMLQRKEMAYGLPLVALFRTIMSGQRTDQQVRQFGDRSTKMMRGIIKETIREFAEASGNHRLLFLLTQFDDFQSNKAMPKRQPVQSPVPLLSTKERDFRSIASVVAQLGRPVGMADFGRLRRRWLAYPPRTPGSSFRNRLEEVLAQMVRENVLRAHRSFRGAVVYSPGQYFDRYRSLASA